MHTTGDAVERQALREVDERALQPLEVVAVRLHVIRVDVRDHRHRGREVEKRRVGLVGLGDEKIALAEPRVRIRRQSRRRSRTWDRGRLRQAPTR
jgi:hypothetical protein